MPDSDEEEVANLRSGYMKGSPQVETQHPLLMLTVERSLSTMPMVVEYDPKTQTTVWFQENAKEIMCSDDCVSTSNGGVFDRDTTDR